MKKYIVNTTPESVVEEVFCFTNDDMEVIAVRTLWEDGQFIIDTSDSEIPQNEDPEKGVVLSEWEGFAVNWLQQFIERDLIWVYPTDKDPKEAGDTMQKLKEHWVTEDGMTFREDSNPFELMALDGWFLESDEYTVFGTTETVLLKDTGSDETINEEVHEHSEDCGCEEDVHEMDDIDEMYDEEIDDEND